MNCGKLPRKTFAEFHTDFSGLRRNGMVRISGRGERMKNDSGSVIKNHAVVSHEEWLAAGTAFLAKGEGFTRLRGQLNPQRRELPREAGRGAYLLEGRHGQPTRAQRCHWQSPAVSYH